MTLKLVADNVASLPVISNQDLSAQLRALADALDAGNLGAPQHLLVLLDGPESLDDMYFGAGMSSYERIGLLQTAAQYIMQELIG